MLCLIAMAGLLLGSSSRAVAAGATFELAQVLGLVEAEITAADAPADDGGRSVRIEEAQVDLDLVEVTGKAGARLVVPGSDFGGKENPPKPVLKRRVVIDIVGARDAKTTEPTAAGEETGSRTRASPESGLARAIDRVESGGADRRRGALLVQAYRHRPGVRPRAQRKRRAGDRHLRRRSSHRSKERAEAAPQAVRQGQVTRARLVPAAVEDGRMFAKARRVIGSPTVCAGPGGRSPRQALRGPCRTA